MLTSFTYSTTFISLNLSHFVRDFKKRIDLYVKEINLYSDLEVSYEKIVKIGRKVTGITFYIKEKTNKERLTAWLNAEDRLDNKSQVEGQINLFDYDEEL